MTGFYMKCKTGLKCGPINSELKPYWPIVGTGGHTPDPLFSKIPSFLEIQDVPTFDRCIKKPKVLNNFCNQFIYHLHLQSILVLEECLQKW